MQPIEHGNLSTDCSHLDQALYVASCMSGASADSEAHIYGTSDPAIADAESGERYIVFRGDQEGRHHLAGNWSLIYTIRRGPRG